MRDQVPNNSTRPHHHVVEEAPAMRPLSYPQVQEYLSASMGEARFSATSRALGHPSLRPSLRVNIRRATTENVIRRLKEELGGHLDVSPHPRLPSTLVLQGRGPNEIDYGPCGASALPSHDQSWHTVSD